MIARQFATSRNLGCENLIKAAHRAGRLGPATGGTGVGRGHSTPETL